MSIRIEVKGGTVSDEHLCLSCRHGKTRTTAHGREITRCEEFNDVNREMIVKCDAYEVRPEPEPQWMLGQALYILKMPSGKIHFLRKEQFDSWDYQEELAMKDQKARIGQEARP